MELCRTMKERGREREREGKSEQAREGARGNRLASWENMAPLYFPITAVHCLVNVIVGLNISSADQSLLGLSDHTQPIKQEAHKK